MILPTDRESYFKATSTLFKITDKILKRGNIINISKFVRKNVRRLKALKEDFDLTEDFLRMDYSVSKFPPSPKVMEVIRQACKEVNNYPDGSARELRKALAKYNRVSSDAIMVGNGSDEIIDMISRTFLEPRDEIIIFTPTFSQYEISAKIIGAKVKAIPSITNRKYAIEPIKVLREISSKTKIIWICNPNNPTGNSIPQMSIKRILESTDRLVAVDECYFEFLEETSLDFLRKYDNLIIVRSMSKTFCLAGLRVGYAIADTEIIKNVWKVKQFFNVNSIAQAAAIAALEDIGYYRGIWNRIAREREYMVKRLSELKDIEIFPSTTNFLLINVSRCKESPTEIYNKLIQRKILILPSWSIDFSRLGNGFFRILVGTREENDKFIGELGKIIGNC